MIQSTQSTKGAQGSVHPPPEQAPPPVWGNGLFVRADRFLARIDGFIARFLPDEVNPLARSGAAANLALIIALVSGVVMLLWYSPSIHFAYPSLEALAGRTLGGWIRAMHRYSSDLAMLLLFVHAGRTLFARKFTGSRWLPWVSGIVLIGLVWFIGWTGFWLVWDQPAQQIAATSMRLLDGLPIFGEPMGRLFVADRLVPSLLFFVVFFSHMLLPLGIAIGLVVHLMRVSRVKLLPEKPLTIGLIAGVALAAILIPAPLDAPARMAEKAAAFTVDAWYMTPLALGLRFQHAGLWIALFGTSALASLLPFVMGRRRPRTLFQAAVVEARCHSCIQCSQDCPFDAITMMPRTDGKKFTSVALVDPARCTGCGVCAGSCDSEGIGLLGFPTGIEEERIKSEIRTAIAAGAPRWVALICGDIDGGFALFDRPRWERRLAGYVVHPVPTSSWIRPQFVEQLLKDDVKGVLIVRDSRPEAWSRDGARWVAERMAGTRSPAFRPKRAGTGTWRIVDFNPSNAAALAREAESFRSAGIPGTRINRPGKAAIVIGSLVLSGLIAAATIFPSHLRVQNPAPAYPEFVLSMKAFGDWVEAKSDPDEDAGKLVHMRGRSTEKPKRGKVVVRIAVDGEAEERAFAAKGISHDGPALDEWRITLTPGEHRISVEIITGPDSEPRFWEDTLLARERFLNVLTYAPKAGFRLE